MVGAQWANVALLLALFFTAAQGLLRGGLEVPLCADSDGLAGYSFSHKGLWIPGYQLLGTGFTKHACSAKCSARADCVAFSGAFKEDGGNGACYTYKATGGNVPSGGDRAYKKCPPGLKGPQLVGVPGAHAMHIVEQTPVPDPAYALMKQAEDMERQLDQVSATFQTTNTRIRRLKSMMSGAANVLTGAGRKASAAAKIALANRGGLQAIGRRKDIIDKTFEALDSSNKRLGKVITMIKSRKPPKADNSMGAGEALRALAPNVTVIEKKLNQLNDPVTTKQIGGLLTSYDGFKSTITATTKEVLFSNIKGLVDTMRGAYHNYTDALANKKKDPCCCKDMKKGL